MKTIDTERDWKELQSHLPFDYEQLAKEHGLINAQWSNAKVREAEPMLRMMLLHAGADLGLRQTVATIAQAGGPKMTQVWLHQKMRRAQPYLAALIARMTQDVDGTPERWSGYEMLCLDATVMCGPGATCPDARIHAVLRLHDLKICEVEVTGASGGETLRRFSWEANQLVIVDRGYSNASGIAHVVEQGADVLVRLNRGALPLYDEQAVVNALEWCRTLRGHRAAERAVHILYKGARDPMPIRGRLIGFRLPEKEARSARERLRRECGSNVTPEQLQAAEYIMLFTTTSTERLSASRCVEAYRLRWQVELQFKRWKSLCHFDRLPNYREDTIRSWLSAKVLLGLLLDRIGSAEGSTTLDSRTRPQARQPWKVAAIAWPLIVAALLPLRLANAGPCLSAIADQLDAFDAVASENRQIAHFRLRFPLSNGKIA